MTLRLALVLSLSLACACTSTSTPADGATTTDGGALVAQCEALAMHMGANCAGSDPRPCVWEGYRQLCHLGNTQLLIDSMNCLDQTTCRSFSDPNQGATCLAMVHPMEETSGVRAVDTTICNACGSSGCDVPQSTGEILPYLSDADANMIAACRGTACTIDAIVAACPMVPGIAPFTSCH